MAANNQPAHIQVGENIGRAESAFETTPVKVRGLSFHQTAE